MASVQESEFHVLVGLDIRNHLDADLLERWTTGDEIVLDNPLDEVLKEFFGNFGNFQ